jgi:hypothetical protein
MYKWKTKVSHHIESNNEIQCGGHTHTCIKLSLASKCRVFQNQPPGDELAFSGLFHLMLLSLV